MPDKGIVVEVYRDSAPHTLVDVINARMEPTALEELRNHGAGSFYVSKLDPKLIDNPSLLEYRNFIRVRLNGVVIGGFIIQNKKTVIVGEGEAASSVWQVSGEGLRSWTRDAEVFPAGGLQSASKETRFFNFASERGSWYNPAQWKSAVVISKWNSPNNWWLTAPSQWPDAPNAMWIWDRSGPRNMPLGYVYFRYEFTTTDAASQAYSFFFAVDDRAEVYVDGELLMTTADHAWNETNRLDFDLRPGSHTIALKAYNYRDDAPGGLLGALFKVGDAASPTSARLVSTTGGAGWSVCGYPSEEPGWTVGDVVLTLLNEAKARGVRFAKNIIPTFTTTMDSSGNAWGKSPWSFGVGASYSDVIEAIEEVACDFYLNPNTLELHAWKKRGVDRSLTGTQANPVIFSVGKNLVAADETGQADIINSLLLHTDEGWVLKAPPTAESVTKFGVIESQLATKLSINDAEALTAELFRQKALPEKSATFQIVPVPGTVPHIDFQVGDYVSAPGESGELETRRVVSISVAEDKVGNPIFSVEFDTIFKDRQSELEKFVSRATGASGAGGGFANSGGLPSTVVQGQPSREIVNVPDAPSGLAVTSAGRWANGSPFADLRLSWNPVISSGEVPITDVTQYEVWGRPASSEELSLITTATQTFVTLPSYEAGKAWVFSVRAVSRTSGAGNMSLEVSHTTAIPNLPLGKPSTPTLTTSLGTVSFKWDGLIAGQPAPAHLAYLNVQRRVGTGAWTNVASLVSLSGVEASLTVGTTYEYRFVPVDYLGVTGTPSNGATVTVTGVGGASLDQDILDAIEEANADAGAALLAANNAVTTANGKNRVIRSTSDASGTSGYNNGDQWWKYSGNNVTGFWIFDGTAWKPQMFGVGSIAPNAVTATEIADSINQAIVDAGNTATSALTAANGKNKIIRSTSDAFAPENYIAGDQWWKYSGTQIVNMWMHTGTAWQSQTLTDSVITNLNAATISAGTLLPARIGANTITASKMLLGDTTNMILDPDFKDPSSWQVSGNRIILPKTDAAVPANAPVVSNVLRMNTTTANNDMTYLTGGVGNRIPVAPGDVFVVDYWIARTADTNSTFRFYMTAVDANGGSAAWPAGPSQTPETVPANTWVRVTGTIKIPNGKYGAAMSFGITSAGTPPAGAWFVGSPVYRKAMQGELIVDGSITTKKMATGSITAESGIIASLDAGVITAGTLGADRIGANTISTQKLLVGDFTNLIEDEDFDAAIGLTWSRRSGSASASNYATTTGLPGKSWKLDGVGTEVSVQSTNLFPVDPSVQYRLNFRAQNNLAGSSPVAYVRILWFKNDGTASAGAYSNFSVQPTNWTDLTQIVVPPEDAFYGRVVLIHGASATSGSWWIGRMSLRRMNGGELIVDGAITTEKLLAGAVTTAKIATGAITADSAIIANGAITNAQIANLDAGKITTGLLNTGRLAANSISTSKLLITSMENLVQDFSFEYNSTDAWMISSPATNATVNPRTGARALQLPVSTGAYQAAIQASAFSVSEGERYRISAWVRVASGTGAASGVALAFHYGSVESTVNTASADTAVSTATVGTTYTNITGIWTVPAGAKFARARVVLRESGSTGRTYYVDDVEVYKMTSGELIVDGTIKGTHLEAETITGDLIRAGAIEVNHISPGVGDSLNISANGSINLITGRQAAVEDALSTTSDALTDLDAALTDVTSDVGAAHGAAASAAATAANAAAKVDEVSTSLTALGNVYRFTPEAAIIGNPGTNSEVRISSAEIGIYIAKTRVSWWNAGQFNTTSLVATEAQIGNHKIEKVGNRTVFRKV